jgi:hypothetical protein
MSAQPQLFDLPERPTPTRRVPVRAHLRRVVGEAPANEPPQKEERDNQKRFETFHAANPGVYAEIERRALVMYRDGASYIGVKGIVEDMRKEAIQTKGSPYRFDNTLTAFFSALLIERHPELRGIVRRRGAA